MGSGWLYIAVFILCYIWGSYGLPYTENQLKALLHSVIFALVGCFAVAGIMYYAETQVGYIPNYHVS